MCPTLVTGCRLGYYAYYGFLRYNKYLYFQHRHGHTHYLSIYISEINNRLGMNITNMSLLLEIVDFATSETCSV